MESLREQINPYLTAQPDPDQTFREYIEQLLQQQPSQDFQSAFAGAPTQESSTSASTPTTSITEGMFRPYLGGGGGGGDSDFGVASTSAGLGGYASANDVVALDSMAQAASTTAGKEAISQVVGLMTGNPIAGIVAGLVAPMALGAAGNQAWSSFNQGVDASDAAFGTAAALGGVGTVSNQAGHVSSFTNPAMVDAFDMATFGTTGAGLASSGGSGSSSGGFSDTGGGFSVSGPSGGFSSHGGGFSLGDVMGGGSGFGGGGDSGGFGGGFGDSGPSGSSGAGGASAAGPGESDGGGGGGGGGGKIVCTAMNQSYGFGSFRQAIWLRYSADHMTKEHEVGYHAMFLPLVDAAYKQDKWYSKPLRKVLENIARHRTADIRAEMREGKRDTLGRVYRAVLEPLCYVVGKIKTL